MSDDLLATIVAATRRIVEVRMEREPLPRLRVRARRAAPRAAAFRAALSEKDARNDRRGTCRLNVIAECKRRSPARGVLRASYDPVALARAYEAAGAAAISVLTEPAFFDGSLGHLGRVREATTVPVLRKDFIVDPYQVIEARAEGADAVLLIVAALDAGRLRGLITLSAEEDLAALVEVHDRPDLDRALEAGATIIGVNNRDLRTLAVDIARSHELIEHVPAGITAVAESGLRSGDEMRALARAGYRAFLIGERLMSAADPGEALRHLLQSADGEWRMAD